MNKEFVNYDIALELKELGYDEPNYFLKWYDSKGKIREGLGLGEVKAPLYQQAFRFFRNTYKLKGEVVHSSSTGKYTYTIWKWNFDNNTGNWERIGIATSWFSYEEAELACLKKLIEICKNK